jgi:hypothetical protein
MFEFLGFGRGKIEIILDKYNFSPGETISGKANFKLNKIVHARGAKIRVFGVKKEVKINKAVFGNSGKLNHGQGFIFDFTQPLDNEKDYSGEFSYEFKVTIPSNVLTNISGVMGSLVNSLQMLSGVSSSIKWYVVAYLDIPGAIDISKKVQINVA